MAQTVYNNNAAGNGPVSAADEWTNRANDLLNGGKNARLWVEDAWKESNDLYNQKFSAQEREWSQFLGAPRLFIPKLYAMIQRILEEVLESLFFDMEEVAGVGTQKNFEKKILDAVKSLINYRLDGHPINFYQETVELVLDGLKNKIGVFKVYPLQRKVRKTKKEKIYENGTLVGEKDVEFEEKIWSPRLECVPYEDVYFPRSSTWKNYFIQPVLHRAKRTRQYCEARGWNQDAINRIFGGMVADDAADPVKQQRQIKQGSPFNDTNAPKAQQEAWIYECWDFRVDENGDFESGSYIVGGQNLMQADATLRGWLKNDLPYKFDPFEPNRHPFVVATPFPSPHQMYGDDFCQIGKGLQNEANAAANAEREAVAKYLRPPVLVDKDAGLDLTALMQRKISGVVIGENIGPDAVRELLFTNPLPVSAPTRQRIDFDFSELTSIPPEGLGVKRPGEKTATEFAGLDRHMSKKLNGIIRNIVLTGIVPALRYLLRMEQMYETDAFIDFVTGMRLGWKFEKKNGQYTGTPPAAAIQGEFDFRIDLGTSKQLQLNQIVRMTELGTAYNSAMIQAVQLGVANPADVKFFNAGWSFKEAGKLLGFRNTDEMTFGAQQPTQPGPGAPGAPTPVKSQNGQQTGEDVLVR